MMKRCILILLTLCISITSLGIMTGCAKKETNPEQSKEDLYQYSDFSDTKEQTNYVKLTVEGFGDMILELYPETAPETVKNFHFRLPAGDQCLSRTGFQYKRLEIWGIPCASLLLQQCGVLLWRDR